jgi:hypothetical protein
MIILINKGENMFELAELAGLIYPNIYSELESPLDKSIDDSPAKYESFKPLADRIITAKTGYTKDTLTVDLKNDIKPAYAWIVEYLAQNLITEQAESYSNRALANFKAAQDILLSIPISDAETVENELGICDTITGVAEW